MTRLLHGLLLSLAFTHGTVGAAAMDLGTEARWDVPQSSINNKRINQMSPRYVRTMGAGTYWSQIQPDSPARWVWSGADACIRANFGKSKIIYETFVAPDWAAGLSRPDFLEAYCNYVAAVCTRYKGKLWAVDIWNEPGPGPKGGLPVTPPLTNWQDVCTFYSKMVAAVAPVVRKIDPAIKLQGPGFYGLAFVTDPTDPNPDRRPFDELRALKAAGTLDLLDVITFHDYIGVSWVQESDPRRRLDITDANGMTGYSLDSIHFTRPILRQLQIIRDVIGPNKPWALTEFGAYTTEQCQNYLVAYRQYGCLYVIPHMLFADSPNDTKGIFGYTPDGKPKQKTKAILQFFNP